MMVAVAGTSVHCESPDPGPEQPQCLHSDCRESDQVIRIGRWVMRSAIAGQARRLTHGLATLPIAINLSIASQSA